MNGNSDIKSFLVVEELMDGTGFENHFLVNKKPKSDGKNKGSKHDGICVLRSAEEKLTLEQRQGPFNPNLYQAEEIFFLKTVNRSAGVEFFAECLAGDVLRSMFDAGIIPLDRQEHFSPAKPVTFEVGKYGLLQPFARGYQELYKLQNPDQNEKTNFWEVFDRVINKQGYEYALKHGRPLGLSYILMHMVGALHNNSVHSGNVMVQIEAYLLAISSDEEIPQDFKLGLIFQDEKLFCYDNMKNPSKIPFQVAPEKENKLRQLLTVILQKNDSSNKKMRLSDTDFSDIISYEEKKDASNEHDPYKIALIHFKIIDYGAAFRYPGSLEFFLKQYTDGNPMPSLEEVHQAINIFKEYMDNYRNMPNLFPTVINHAKNFLRNTKENREQLKQIYLNSVKRQLINVYKKYIKNSDEWPQERAKLIAYMYGSHSYGARDKLMEKLNAMDTTADADELVAKTIGEMLYDAAIKRLKAMRAWKPTHGWEAKREGCRLYKSAYIKRSASYQDTTLKSDDASTVIDSTVSSASSNQDISVNTPLKNNNNSSEDMSVEEFNNHDSRRFAGNLWDLLNTMDNENSPRKKMMRAAPTLQSQINNLFEGLKNDDDIDINDYEEVFQAAIKTAPTDIKFRINSWISVLSQASDAIESLTALYELLQNEPKEGDDVTASDAYIAGIKKRLSDAETKRAEKLKQTPEFKDFNTLVETCEKALECAQCTLWSARISNWIEKCSRIADDPIKSLTELHQELQKELSPHEAAINMTDREIYFTNIKEAFRKANKWEQFQALVESCEAALNSAKHGSVMSDLTMTPSLRQNHQKSNSANMSVTPQFKKNWATTFSDIPDTPVSASSLYYLSLQMNAGMTPEKKSGDDSDHSDTEEEGSNYSKILIASPQR